MDVLEIVTESDSHVRFFAADLLSGGGGELQMVKDILLMENSCDLFEIDASIEL